MRLFVAIPLDAGARRALEDRIHQIGRTFSAMPVKWVRPENWHLTLRFLGETDPARVEVLTSRLRGACVHFPGQDLALSGLGAFPNALEPRVIWVGLSVPSQFMKLAESVRNAAEGFGQPGRDHDVFHPHLTIGRVKDVAAPQRRALGRDLEQRDFGAPIPWRVNRVVLMRSDLRPGGSTYTELAEFRLK